MKWNKEKASYILCIILIIFALFAPSIIQTEVERDRYREWVQPTPPVWQGQLTLWAIVGFPMGQNTLSGWVRTRVRAFEEDTFGVYVDAKVMQWEDAKVLLQAGEKPDVMIFPTGFLDSPDDMLIPLDVPGGINAALADSAKHGGKTYALPVMAGAYILAVNEEKGMIAGVDPPEEIGYTPEETVNLAQGEESALCVDDGTFSNPGLAFAYDLIGGNEDAIKALAQIKNAQVFFKGNGLLCLGNQNTAATAQANYENGEGFSNTVWAVSGFTDMVQYVGVVKGQPEAKTQICEQFCESLLSEKAQESVKTLGMFPAVRGKPLYEDDPRFWAAEQEFAKNMAVPSCFGYENVRARWSELLQKAASGNAGALRALLSDMDATCKQG
ncbi:MAG: hypothetical protein ACOYU3_09445 [Bacillota bacterium]